MPLELSNGTYNSTQWATSASKLTMAALLAERAASLSLAGRHSTVTGCRKRSFVVYNPTLADNMCTLQTLRSFEGFRASAPRFTVHVCRQPAQVTQVLLCCFCLTDHTYTLSLLWYMSVHCGVILCLCCFHIFYLWSACENRHLLSWFTHSAQRCCRL